MSFSSEIKLELVRIYPGRRCCRMAELAALLRFGARLEVEQGESSLILESELPAVARKAVRLLGKLVDLHPEVEIAWRQALGKGRYYRLRLPVGARLTQALDELGLMETLGGEWAQAAPGVAAPAGGSLENASSRSVAPRILRRPCCRTAYLRGAYLATGSLTHPLKSYHLEMVFRQIDQAQEVGALISETAIEPHFFIRKGRHVVYLKGGEAITDLLARVGGYDAKFRWEEMRIRRELRGTANRLVNCDTANVAKAVGAALRQREAIAAIERAGALDALSDGLVRIAELRLAYPHAGLAELGELSDPPLSKSAVNHRLRRLLALADSLEVW